MMYSLTQNKTETAQELSKFLSKEIKIKPLFVGYGVFCEQTMFAIYVDDLFHLKAEGRLAEILKRMGAIVWFYSPRKNMRSQSTYFRLPEILYENKTLLHRIITLSIKQAHRKGFKDRIKPKSSIRDLPNLTARHERLLAKIEVNSIEELRTIGAENAFIALKKKGYDISLVWYWTIVAALRNKLVQVLTYQEKEIAFNLLNEKLFQENMREIKKDEFQKSCLN